LSDRYRYLLRMPVELRDKVTGSAKRHGRSFNAEVLHRLERSFEPAPARRLLDGAGDRIVRLRGEQMVSRRHGALVAAVGVLAVAAIALIIGIATSGSSSSAGKRGAGDPEALENSAVQGPGEGPLGGNEAEKAAQLTYPANVIPLSVTAKAEATFEKIKKGSRSAPNGNGVWQQYGPESVALQPGVLAFSGATNATASRTPALLLGPTCVPGNCRLWAGASGGGVWRTDDALAENQNWKYLTRSIEQNSVGTLTADPNDPTGNTIYLGTGEGNRCTSGCESGVGIYKTTDGGNHWQKLAGSCVDNSTYACVSPGVDAFLGRAINAIVIDPTDSSHIYVGSAQGVRGLSHVIGNGGQVRLEPDANQPGLYESHDGGATFTEVWNGNDNASFGVTDVALDPLDTSTVYAAAFDAGLWRRDSGATATDFKLVFAPRFAPSGGRDRVMVAATVKNGKTRIYLTDGVNNGGGIVGATAAEFWRTDNANQPAATLLASQAPGLATPAGNGKPFPASYNGWQRLTSDSTASPYFPTVDFCTGQCWYDQDVITPTKPLMPDTVYVIGSFTYGEVPCLTKGVGCGNNRSNGRAVLYSDTAGDPDAANNNRTFTDLTYDMEDEPANWCALPALSPCLFAPNSIHPDQHELVVNPSNPTQIFEASDGGIIRTSGSFGSTSSQCTTIRQPLSAGSTLACQRLLSRIPTQIDRLNVGYGSTLQFENVAINPQNSCEVMGGTQDNGTWTNVGCGTETFTQTIYGDGGNAGYDGANPAWRFNQFTSGFSDSNFRNGDPEKWVITSAPIVNSGETTAFYWPQAADPNPVPGAHPIFSGSLHVWRTWAFGAGTPGAVPQDKNPNIAFYEANCPEFTTSGANASCGDYQPLGGPQGANQPGDLTGTVYGADRAGGSISWLARNGADHGTLWATTSAGRVFVTHNADASTPASVVWHRIDNATSPTRFPSGIYPDPDDTRRAWISYSGYNAATPTTPGHVFVVREGGTAAGSGVFTNLNVERGTAAFPTPNSNGDLPVNDVVRDDSKHTLYVATDFGVVKGSNDGKGSWTVPPGMPRLEITHLEIQPSSRVPTCVGAGKKGCRSLVYAATHSQGIWVHKLGGRK